MIRWGRDDSPTAVRPLGQRPAGQAEMRVALELGQQPLEVVRRDHRVPIELADVRKRAPVQRLERPVVRAFDSRRGQAVSTSRDVRSRRREHAHERHSALESAQLLDGGVAGIVVHHDPQVGRPGLRNDCIRDLLDEIRLVVDRRHEEDPRLPSTRLMGPAGCVFEARDAHTLRSAPLRSAPRPAPWRAFGRARRGARAARRPRRCG